MLTMPLAACPASSRRPTRRQFWILCVLLPALLLAQWIGLSHRLSHAGWADGKLQSRLVLQQANVVWQFFAADNDEKNLHSCALVDAATSADYLHAIPALLPDISRQPIAISDSHYRTWLASVRVPFSSRAPPVFS